MAFEVLGKPATSADPCKSSFDDPSLGQDLELRNVVAVNNFNGPRTGFCDGSGELWSLIAGIGKDPLDERKHAARAAIENQGCAVAVLHICGMDDDIQEEAKRVDKNVPFAAFDLFARVIARWIERTPPF